MKPKQYDFSGWATVNNIRCSDGRTILRDAFAHQNGMEVPLVWGHVHDDPENTIGKAYLENRPEGVYTYASFNSGKKAAAAKIALEHGDINSLSIFANHLKQDDKRNVMHGDIKEVSLVLSGANPGAVIDFVLAHSDDNEEDETSAIIYNPIENIEVVSHSDDETQPAEETLEHAENDKEESAVYLLMEALFNHNSSINEPIILNQVFFYKLFKHFIIQMNVFRKSYPLIKE